MKAVIYCRVSTEEQAQENHHSLDAQKRLCSDFAKQKGYQVVKIFEDAGKSGRKMEGRNALLDLMDFVKDENINAVLVQDTDRLARNTNDHLAIKTLLLKHGTSVISVSQPTIDDSAEGKLIDTIIASVNTFQSDITRRKTQKGLEQKALSGWFPGSAPIGYKNAIDDRENRIIVVDPENANLVKLAFDLYIKGGYGVNTINDILYKKGFRSKAGLKLHRSKMDALLQNPFYIGKFKYAKKIYDANHEPIISQETFDLAQKIRQTRSFKSYKRQYDFLLNGYLFCQCGRRFTAENHFKPSGLTFRYYHCTNGKACTHNKSFRCEKLEETTEELFKSIEFTSEFYNRLIEKLKSYYNTHIEKTSQETTKVAKRREELIKKRDKAENMLLDGTIDKETYQRLNNNLNSEISAFDNELSHLKKTKFIDIATFEDVANYAKNIYGAYKNGIYEVKRMYLDFFWQKFIVNGTGIIEAIPTPLFQALMGLQKAPQKEELFAEFIDNSNPKKFSLGVMNCNDLGG